MKRMIALLLVLTIVFSFAGCDKENEKPYIAGITEGNVYTQDYFGIKCTLPDEWYFYTDEQIAQVKGYTQDLLSEDYAKILEKSGSVMEMYASDEDTGVYTLNVNVEKLSSAKFTEKQCIDKSIEQIKGALESSGFNLDTCESVKLNFAGKECSGVNIKGDFQGMAMYQKIAVIKDGRYLICIGACSFVEDRNDEILGFFSAI